MFGQYLKLRNILMLRNRLTVTKLGIAIRVICLYGFVVSLVNAAESIIPIPENAKTEWVSNNLNQSGMVLSIRTFKSPDAVESVLAFFRDAWTKEGKLPGFIEDEMMEWNIISHLRKTDNVVLQIKSGEFGGATGFLSIAQLDGEARPVESDFPIPETTEEFSVTYLRENEADVHTMTYITKQSIGTTSAFYKDRLKSQGWSIASDSKISGSHILLFNRRDDRCEMVIQQLSPEETVIFVNRVLSDA